MADLNKLAQRIVKDATDSSSQEGRDQAKGPKRTPKPAVKAPSGGGLRPKRG